jgi:hypothetical protein
MPTLSPARIPNLMWRECINKIWEVDPLTCPGCTGELHIISFIYKKTVIKEILTIWVSTKRRTGEHRISERHRQSPATIELVEIVPYKLYRLTMVGRDMMSRFSIF